MTEIENKVSEEIENKVSEESKPKKNRKTTPVAIYPERPTRIVSIDGEYIKAFFKGEFEKGTITRKEIGQWADKAKKLIQEKGERAYFQEFRTEFVKKFFPELEKRKTEKVKKESMANFLENLLS